MVRSLSTRYQRRTAEVLRPVHERHREWVGVDPEGPGVTSGVQRGMPGQFIYAPYWYS
jgi:hypothetical protein